MAVQAGISVAALQPKQYGRAQRAVARLSGALLG